MIELLRGTILDLGPAVWAVVIILSLVLIEVFQLGPHSLGWIKNSVGTTRRGGPPRNVGSGGKKSKPGFAKQRRRKNKNDFLKSKPIRDIVLINGPCSFLVINMDKRDFELKPHFDSKLCSERTKSGLVYPEKIEPGSNYVSAHGEESNVIVLDKFKALVDASEDIGSVCLFSSIIPSVFALHKLVELKKESAIKLKDADMCIFYEELDEECEDPERLMEKQQFLCNNVITLEKVAIL